MSTKTKKIMVFALCLLLIALVFPEPAWAYMDPGSGSALVYVLISIVSAFYFLIKSVFYRLKRGKNGQTPVLRSADDIVILSEGKIYQFTYRPIIEALIERDQAFSYLTMNVDDPLLEIEHPLMNSRYIGEGVGAYLRTLRVSAKIALSTTPHIGIPGYQLPRPRKVGCLAHVFHAAGAGHYYRKHGLDRYDSILLQSMKMEPSIRKLETVRKFAPRECCGVGLPYFDVLARKFGNISDKELPVAGEPTVLVAPTWGKKGTLALCIDIVIPRLLESGYRVILRPHPQSYKSDAATIDTAFSRYGNNRMLRIDRNVESTASMLESTVMISDMSGIRFDYAFIYGKPVLTIENAICTEEHEIDVIGLDNPWDVLGPRNIGVVLSVEELNDIAGHVEMAMSKSREKILSFRDEWVDNFGHAGDAVAEWLVAAKDKF